MKKSYTIFERYTEDVKKELIKLEKKALKFGAYFHYKVEDPYVKEIPINRYDPVCNTIFEVDRVPCLVRDVIITAEDIKMNSWTVSAQLEHFQNGNIVYNFSGQKIDPRWQKAKPHCDHCNTNRFRRITYICQNEYGEEKQIGSSCLQDYTGINPAYAVWWAQAWFDPFKVSDTYEEHNYDALLTAKVYDVETMIGRAVDVISKHGYVKSDMPNSTKSEVTDATYRHIMPSKEAEEKAKAIISWLLTNKNDFAWDSIEAKVVLLAEQKWCKTSHIGLISYIPVAYDRYVERERKYKERREEAKRSNYVGEVGKKITFAISSCMAVTSWDTQYGTTYIWKFTDSEGNVLVWKTSIVLNPKTAVGHTITGTVKEHKQFRDEKQTELTRCKIIR